MRITDLQVDGFGVWSGLTVEEVSTRMTVFYGPNEAGKTTLLQFVRAILYGFAPERREKYLPPVHGGQGGGSIYLNHRGSEFQIQRLAIHGQTNIAQGDLALMAADGTVAGQDALERLLGNVNENVFSNVFAIGLREIQELATLNDTDAAHELYKLASGLDRVSLIDVMRQLREEREQLIGRSAHNGHAGAPGEVNLLTGKLREIERQIEQARGGSRRWVKLGAELTEIDRDLDTLARSIEEQEKEGRQVEMAMQIAPRWRERDSFARRIESYGTLPTEDKVSVDRLDRANTKLGQINLRGEEVARRSNEIRQHGKSLPINRRLLDSACRIEAVAEHLPWMESLERTIARLGDEMTLLHKEMGLRQDGRDDADFTAIDVKTFEITPRTMATLKPAAVALKKSRQRVEAAEHELHQWEQRLAETQEELETKLAECHCHDLDEALEEAGRQVHHIKRRRQIDERMHRLEQQRRQLEEEIDDANEEQILPVGRSLFVGLFVIVGMALAFFGFAGALPFMTAIKPNPVLGTFGVCVALVGWVIKLVGDARARSRLERTQRQFDLLAGQIQRARMERDQLDAGAADDPRSVDERLADAEHELETLESLLPKRAEVAECEHACEEAREQLEHAQLHGNSTQERWESALKSVRLPASLTPARVKALSEQSERISESRQRLGACRDELSDRQQELEQLTGRVYRIAEETKIDQAWYDEEGIEDFHDLDAPTLIRKLIDALNEQRSLRDQRKELHVQHKEHRRQLRSLKRQRRRVESYRTRMFESVHVNDEKSYRELAVRIGQRKELLEKLTQLDQQIDVAIGRHFKREEILAIVESRGESGLESYWESLSASVEQLEKKQAELNVLRGERLHEMKTLGEDRTCDRLELEAETLRKRIRQHATNWQALALTNNVLDAVRKRYEQERQPETLTEASRYLKMISRGKYVRIWTRLEGDTLFVDQKDGGTLRVDVLSQGTREAIFLSLRLALASAYAKRGIQFPLVLDDLLVNYDAERTRAAAQVLVDYASQGRQVIYFTCHDHIRDLFHDLEADVRILPSQRDVLDRDATAERYIIERMVVEPAVVEVEPAEEEYEEEWEEEVVEAIEEPSEEVPEEEVEEEYEEEVVDESPEEEWEDEEEDEYEYEEEVVDEVEEPEVEVPVPQVVHEEINDARRERFTWNSPDMWWEDDGEDAA